MENIASEAGVSVGSVYRLFKSKAAVIEAIVIEEVEHQLSQIELALAQATGQLDRLPKLIAERVSKASIDHDRTALMLEIIAEVCRSPALRDFVRRKRDDVHAAIAETLKARWLGVQEARRLIGQLDWASAIATGLALHELVYAGGVHRSPGSISRLFEMAASES